MNFKGILLVFSTFFLPLNATAIPFDYVAPTKVYFNQSQLGIGIGTPFWGLLVAKNNDLTLDILQNAVVNASIDNPSLKLFHSNSFMNLHLYAPLLTGDVAGYSSAGPVTNSSVLLSYLNTSESLKYADGQIEGLGILFEQGWLGKANLNYEIIIGSQHVKFTTELNFVNKLHDDLWVEVTEGTRLSSKDVVSVPISSTLGLLLSGFIVLFGFFSVKKN